MSLVVENLRKDVGAETHIRDVSLTLETGAVNVLLGATLSGNQELNVVETGVV